jgi:ubiquinone/menaquinone biosynthesis C-methylase UbiE
MSSSHVCPWWLTWTFDNPLRRLVHDPDRILSPHVDPGDRVADVGCGMGYFTIPLARRVGPQGRVLAVDLQQRQLSVVESRAQHAGLRDRVSTRLASPGRLDLDPDLAFVLAFWMLHEVPDVDGFLAAVFASLAPGGILLVAEPTLHVSGRRFHDEMERARRAGFVVEVEEGIPFSLAARLKRP